MFMNLFPKIFLRRISTTSTTTTRKLLKSSKIPKRSDWQKLPHFPRIDYNNGASGLLPVTVNKVFFSEDGSILDAACALSGFGFPWDKLGKLYEECSSIFRRSPEELKSKLCEFKKYGFGNVEVVGICLAFPNILGEEDEFDGEIDGLFTDLKLVFLDFELARSVEENIDSWHEVCRKIRVFYNLNGEKGKLGELMGRAKAIFIEYGEDELIQKAEYFCRFGVKKEEVALLLLKAPDLLNIDLQIPLISVSKLLKHFGLSLKILEDVSKKYDHVLGTNKMDNLPNVMRALDLHEWFFNKMKDGNHNLLLSYLASHPNEDQDEEYQAGLEKICASRSQNHRMRKLNFLHGLGFGENALTIDIAARLHGNRWELQKRSEFLLHLGFEFSDLCIMVKRTPKILNQKTQVIDKKVKFFCQELGIPLKSLIPLAVVLIYNLEDRIKPRHRFLMWLKEKGLLVEKYSIGTVISCSSNRFVDLTYRIHPAAPKHWFEQFYIPPNTHKCYNL
ncbi:hypothetical protein K1719_040164 [Acacia pycnantha]|nr:hypothetical protein K1719_040164 [Acacia pycnantha]